MNNNHDTDGKGPGDTHSDDDRIDIICDEFESQWVEGRSPDLKSFLACVQELGLRDRLFRELLLVDLDYRNRDEPGWTPRDYTLQFPEFAEQIEALEFEFDSQRSPFSASQPAPAWELSPSARFAQFELREQLGAGAFGVVWKAWDTQLKRIVALKLPRLPLSSPEDRQRFLKEAQAAAQLDHPHIVPVLAIPKEAEGAFIVSKYVAGENLRARLKQRKLKPVEASYLCQELARALHHAHEKGVIHRDFKPENVLIDEQGAPHITDFGVAKVLDDGHHLTMAGDIVGTPAYMSPEQAMGRSAEVDRRTDVYSLGVLLYELLTGEIPLSKRSANVYRQIVEEPPRSPRALKREIPRDLETICLKALEKKPDCRYQTAAELAEDLGRFIDRAPILARRAGLAEQGWRWVRRHRLLTALIGAILFSSGLLVLLYLQSHENRSLLGLRTLHLTTEPPGAKVAFVPLEEATGEPDPSKMIQVRARTPFQLDLRPGMYLVEAVLDDGRFHQVFRTVPKEGRDLPGSFSHFRWTEREDGEVELPRIKIPPLEVTQGMAYFAGADELIVEHPEPGGPRKFIRQVPAFYLDSHEYSRGSYKQPDKYCLPCIRGLASDQAATATYEFALSIAESEGKRLPWEKEFEFALSRIPPRAEEIPVVDAPTEDKFGPVGTAGSDQIEGPVPVFGLLSNVAEWTATRFNFVRPQSDSPIGVIAGMYTFQVVRGGDSIVIDGSPTTAPAHRDPRTRTGMPKVESRPGLGFRGVRSAKPQFVAGAAADR